jgi:hypothetical protein
MGTLYLSSDGTRQSGGEMFYSVQYTVVADCFGDICDTGLEPWGVDFNATGIGSTSESLSE